MCALNIYEKYYHCTKLYREILQACCHGIVTIAQHEWQCQRWQM